MSILMAPLFYIVCWLINQNASLRAYKHDICYVHVVGVTEMLGKTAQAINYLIIYKKKASLALFLIILACWFI